MTHFLSRCFVIDINKGGKLYYLHDGFLCSKMHVCNLYILCLKIIDMVS
jgi:hypothetical protein